MTTNAGSRAARVLAPATSVLGLLVMMTPLAMWVAWTEAMFVAVLTSGVVAGALYLTLDRYENPASRAPGGGVPSRTLNALDDQTVAELSNLNPMIFHNRLSAEPRLRRTLDRVKRALERGN